MRPNRDDPVIYYYLPFFRRVFRRRLEVAAELLGDRRFERLVEIGYGSGIFLLELATRCRELYATDIHGQSALVARMLEQEGVRATLLHDDIRATELPAGAFDAVVCLSVLEHYAELDQAVGTLSKIVHQEGVVVAGMPVRNLGTDTFFRVVGYDPRAIHPSSHQDVLDALGRVFTLKQVVWIPARGPSLYVVCRCEK